MFVISRQNPPQTTSHKNSKEGIVSTDLLQTKLCSFQVTLREVRKKGNGTFLVITQQSACCRIDECACRFVGKSVHEKRVSEYFKFL